VPEPNDDVTLIETTDGVTRAAMLFTSIVGAPSVKGVRAVEHPDDPARKIAWVFLSTQTFTPNGCVVAAVATPPTMPAPKRNAAINLVEVFTMGPAF
jgi:hypothetical protein